MWGRSFQLFSPLLSILQFDLSFLSPFFARDVVAMRARFFIRLLSTASRMMRRLPSPSMSLFVHPGEIDLGELFFPSPSPRRV